MSITQVVKQSKVSAIQFILFVGRVVNSQTTFITFTKIYTRVFTFLGEPLPIKQKSSCDIIYEKEEMELYK